ncbi:MULTISPECIES: hypothetical protein [unclassified Bradyrhizobium]|uniref:hypothetical protein n=1 Tax=unclassified Bradyrhizobium TaxID=2631580 RepID=UPI00291703E3|nr:MULTISPECIES: hypothetical protein [unclassified Bradyrhizobium]
MEQIVKFGARQKVTVDDINNLGLYARDSMDHVVSDALVPTAKYAGGDVSISGTTTIKVATPFRLWSQGRVYGNETDNGVTIDLIGQLPTTGFKRICAICLVGLDQADKVEERDFLVNATTRETQAQPTATRDIRTASVQVVAGAAAVDPAAPAVPIEALVMAYVTLTPSAVQVVTQVTANRLASLVDVDGRLIVVEQWKDITQPIIDGMRSDIAKLQQQAQGNQSKGMTVYLLEQVARLSDMVGVDDAASYSKTDWFLDQRDSDITDPRYVAKVEEGLRFADANAETSSPVLSNPADTKFVVGSDGLLLPAFTSVPLVSNIGKDSEVALSNAGAQNITSVQRTVSQTRIRWGTTYLICTNSAMWQSGRYDPVSGIFTDAAGNTYQVLDPQLALINHQMIRIEQFWTDTYQEIYWDTIVTTAAFVGNVCSQTFMAPRAAWLTKVRLGFSRLDTQGDLRILIAKVTPSSSPDPVNVLQTVTVPASQLKLYPTITDIPIPPVYVEAGQRVAVIMITPGNHWLAMCENNKYAQGTFFTSTDGAWFQGDISRDACFEIQAAAFSAPRVVIDLDPWSCNGGMTDIDMMLTQIAPDPTNIVFEVKVNNVWYPIAAPPTATTPHPLTGQPASVGARMTLNGTTEVMPGIYLNLSKVTRSRPRTDGVHVSTERDVPGPVTEVQVIATLEDFQTEYNKVDVKLLTGGTFANQITASTVADVLQPDGSVRRTFTYSGLPSLTKFKRMISIGTDSPLRTFHVACLTDVAIP